MSQTHFLSLWYADFDELIAKHVELSFFVPLIMGHGGNTGSQATCAVIRWVGTSPWFSGNCYVADARIGTILMSLMQGTGTAPSLISKCCWGCGKGGGRRLFHG